MKIDNEELLMISGGATSATLINAIVKGISIIIELGKSLGTTIRRVSEHKVCDF